jgi:hypothetical protein
LIQLQPVVDDVRRQVAEKDHLGAAEPHPAYFVVVEGEKPCGVGLLVIEERAEAPENRVGCFHRQLL